MTDNLHSFERTMNSLRLMVVCALAVAACHPDAVTNSPVVPTAVITWINVVPDTGQLDVHAVDIASNAGLYTANFRDALAFPQAIEAGTRQIKAFIHSTNPAITSQFILDTTYAFVANEQYGFYLSGFARAGAAAALIVPGAPPTPPAGQIAVRVVNLAPSFAGSIRTLADTTAHPDAFLIKGNGLAGGTPQIANVAYRAVSPYVFVDTGRIRMVVAATGTTDPAIAQGVFPLGALGTGTTNPTAGSLVPGTVFTAIIVPRSVPLSAAPQSRPSSKATDTTVAEAARRISRSNDTVTVQSGSVTILTNRSPTKPDSTLRTTGTAAGAGVAAGDIVLVSGTAQPEYTGWQVVIAVADTLICNPTNVADTPTKCAATNDTATTRFRFRYRIVGTPASPGTGTTVYRIYAPSFVAADFVTPQIVFIVDKRPPNTAP